MFRKLEWLLTLSHYLAVIITDIVHWYKMLIRIITVIYKHVPRKQKLLTKCVGTLWSSPKTFSENKNERRRTRLKLKYVVLITCKIGS